jgi:hypothetical protein
MTKTLKVNRATWRCGSYNDYKHGIGPTYLLNEQGFMCCLGHCSLQLGATEKDILDKAGPSSVRINLGPLHKDDGYTSVLAEKAMEINDDEYTREERELKLTKLFAEYDLELVFEGDYVA